MKFTIIDKKTGKESTNRVIDNIAKKGGQIIICEDGPLVLVDAYGTITYCDTMRFKVITEQEQVYKSFAEWVADEIFSENWEDNKGAFPELACRRLEKLGVVKVDGDKWKLKEG